MSNNPFIDAYDAIADTLADSEAITDLVHAGNIVRRDNRSAPIFDGRRSGDTPCLDLVPVPGGERNLHATSDTMTADLTFELQYKTNQDQLGAAKGLFALDWAVTRALFRANRETPAFGCRRITKAEVSDWSPLAPDEASIDGDPYGWQSSLLITVEIAINENEL